MSNWYDTDEARGLLKSLEYFPPEWVRQFVPNPHNSGRVEILTPVSKRYDRLNALHNAAANEVLKACDLCGDYSDWTEFCAQPTPADLIA